MPDVEQSISKSLDEIDNLVANFKASDISKAFNDEDNQDPAPEDVSEDAPAPDEVPDGNDTPDQADSGDAVDANAGGDDTANEDVDEDMGKSIDNALTGSESVKKALEVSEFLRDMVKGLQAILSEHDSKLAKSLEGSQKSQDLLAKSFEGIVKSQKVILESQAELAKSIGKLSQRMQKVEEQPLVRKSVASAAKVQDKSFGTSSGLGGNDNSNKISKSEALTKLSAAFAKGNTAVTHDILALEGTGDLNAMSPLGKQIVGMI